MGRPSHLKPARRPAPSRRQFFKSSGSAAAAAVAATTLGHLAPLAAATAAGPVFLHGVASGDPLQDRVILWTRVTVPAVRAVSVAYEVALDPAFAAIVLRGAVETTVHRDFTVKVDADTLRPGTTYYYRFVARGETSPIGRTRTLPSGNVSRLRMAVVSCSNHAYGYFNAYRRVAERNDLDLVLHLGDYLYEYGAGQYGTARTPEPAHEMVVLSDYRQRHAQYKRDADLQEVHRQHPMIAIWDDHEITNDSWVGGAENHTPETEGQWSTRVSQGLQAYYEWMPMREMDADRRRNQRSFRFGNLAEIVLLEERLSARSQQLPATVPTPFGNGFVQAGAFADPSRTLLGAEQEAWLAKTLRSSPARWKLVGQGVMFAQLKLVGAPLASGGGVFVNADQWDGYQPARDRLYSIIKGSPDHPRVDNVVILTGDIHSSFAADLCQDPNNPDVGTGGYDAATGSGSHAVEFVTTSITSPGLNDPAQTTANYLRSVNPHLKHIDFNQRGYMILDVTSERVTAEWWYVDTVASVSHVQAFGIAFETLHGSNRLRAAAQTRAIRGAPPLAPVSAADPPREFTVGPRGAPEAVRLG